MYQIKTPHLPSNDRPVRLPTMYDLPSEDPEEPGLPDEFHDFQPDLLRETFLPPNHPKDELFIGADINLYYNEAHTNWYKRPDWFLCLGMSGETERELRLSYVMWQEKVNPFLVVELLSPGTEDEDLGQKVSQKVGEEDKPPLKWEVYERVLQVPYYGVFDRYASRFRLFKLEGRHYREILLEENAFWFEELGLGLGIWEGKYQGKDHKWLRWYDGSGRWILTESEGRMAAEELAAREMRRADEALKRMNAEAARADEALQRASEEGDRADRLAAKLRALGIDPDA
jgi:Uma2 family endonuclease